MGGTKAALLFLISLLLSCLQRTICCVQAERLSLLDFKAGLLHDPNNSLASWVGQDCCQWEGVECSNTTTGHVIHLDLHDGSLGGEIRPSLLGLNHLTQLDLSGNNFQGITIPTFIASLNKLEYLDLSDSEFSGLIPYQLGNLSSLGRLDLSSMDNSHHLLYMDSGRWLSNLSSLQYLELGGVDLSKADGWFESLNSLPSLSWLSLKGAELGDSFPLHLSHVNFTSLGLLDLDAVGMNSVPSWLFQIPGLLYLYLGSNKLQNLIPDSIGNLTSLHELDLSDNGYIREIPATFGKLCMLNYLSLSGNYYDADKFNELGETLTTTGCIKENLNRLFMSDSNLTGPLPDWLWEFKNLTHLGLSNNSFYGAPLPPSHQQLPPLLQYLDLHNNTLNGTIPETLGQMSQLVQLHLSNNNLEGVLSEAHFSNLKKLQLLDLGFNSFVLDVGFNWVPPLGLILITFSHCKVGPAFPSWIRELQNLYAVDISHASITDVIPSWFWNFSSEMIAVDLSNNEINGTLPSSLRHLINLEFINLSNNLLEGPLPQFPSSLRVLDLSNNSLSGTVNSDMLMPNMTYLSVSTNHINGSIPLSICNLKNLVVLDFSKNHLSEEIPNCWDSNIGLKLMDLSNNNLSGGIPISICSIPSFQSLHLNGNHLSGKFPLTLRNCTEMRILDLGQNMFSGTIPTWIGQTMPLLQVLRLRSNLFFENIPPQLGHLKNLRFVDLALNNLSGTIPHSFADLGAMKARTIHHSFVELRYNPDLITYGYSGNYVEKINVIMKGREDEYGTLLPFLFSIDLAGNSLTGEIPEELTTLHGLQNLNLSRNHLTGNITEKISELQLLESLDLSNNNLSGAIPSSMTAMHFLNSLNLSFNNFSGKIPSGGQLDALPDPSIYIGNQELCGFPLNKKCQYDEPSQPPQQLKTDSKMVEFYLSIGLGFVVSYLLFWGTLIIKNKWRITYFRFVDDMFDWVYVAVAINMARMKNKWNSL